MKTVAALTLGVGLLSASANAAVDFKLVIEAITGTDGSTAISDSGLLVLVVDTGEDGFQLPSDGNLVSGNDEVVAYWDLADFSFDSPDLIMLSESIPWGSNWTENDDLALFWFPTLDGSNMTPGSDTPYGVFSDSSGLAGGDGWYLPANGTFGHRLEFFTSAATTLVDTPDLPAGAGVAAFAVNNPPSTTAPGAPSVDVSASGSMNVLTWSSSGAPSGGYLVQRSRDGGSTWETIGFASGGDTSFEDSDVKPGREYDYQLYSLNALAYSEGNDTPIVVGDRSVFKAIASRASLVASPPAGFGSWSLINAGVRLAGNDPYKKVLALGLGPHFNAELGTTAWVDDTTVSYNILGDATIIAANDNWMEDIENPSNVDPDAEAALITMGEVGSPVLQTDSLDSSILEDVPINTNNLFKVRSNGTDGFVGIQLYDAEYDAAGGPTINDNRFVSISSRGYLADGGVFNGTVVISGDVPKEVLAVARGPQLVEDGANPDVVLEDPVISLRALGVGEIASNDDWDTQIDTSNPANGLLAVETDMTRLERILAAANVDTSEMTKDSAMLVTLNPGQYNFRVLAGAGSKGDGSVIIEVTEIEID